MNKAILYKSFLLGSWYENKDYESISIWLFINENEEVMLYQIRKENHYISYSSAFKSLKEVEVVYNNCKNQIKSKNINKLEEIEEINNNALRYL